MIRDIFKIENPRKRTLCRIITAKPIGEYKAFSWCQIVILLQKFCHAITNSKIYEAHHDIAPCGNHDLKSDVSTMEEYLRIRALMIEG